MRFTGLSLPIHTTKNTFQSQRYIVHDLLISIEVILWPAIGQIVDNYYTLTPILVNMFPYPQIIPFSSNTGEMSESTPLDMCHLSWPSTSTL